MQKQSLGNLLLLGTLCLTLNQCRQSRVVSPVPETLLPGKYINGYMHDWQILELKQDHQFSYEQFGVIGATGRKRGTWELQGDTLVLNPEDRYSPSLNLRFIPVAWNKQLSLVDENEMPAFCQSRLKNNKFGTYGRYTKALPATGIHIPTVIPQRFQDFLERGEIVARVVSIGREGIVMLEGKLVSRLQPGMHLCWRQSDNSGKCELRITETGPGFARARQVSIDSRYDARVSPGELFTTGVDLNTPAGTGAVELPSN